MISKPLWEPTLDNIKKTKMSLFIDFINDKYDLKHSNYLDFHNWSIDHYEDFWSSLINFLNIKYIGKTIPVISDNSMEPGLKWFEDVKLNFAENLLK